MAIKNPDKLVDVIVSWIKERMDDANVSKLSVDISGGIDSAVTVALSVKTAGNDNVIGSYSGCHSSKESLEFARLVADKFKFKLVEYSFEKAFDLIVNQCKEEFKRLNIEFPDMNDPKNRVIWGSLRSTLRAPIGRFTNRAFGGGLRVGTGNRDEDELVRFYQKGGDGEVDINPIAGLFKSEVWELAKYLGVPQPIIDAVPSPDLWAIGKEHTDEKELEQITGVELTYTRPGKSAGTIEWVSRENEKNGIITGIDGNLGSEELIKKYGYTDKQVKIISTIRHLEKITRHKAVPPPHIERETMLKAGVIE
ncbi:MAG: NAD(+) synthase [Desulfobacterales bacterium]|nr:NAD(+) synthase [Desulfobacterales bacterium]